jgi:hypothetical protein
MHGHPPPQILWCICHVLRSTVPFTLRCHGLDVSHTDIYFLCRDVLPRGDILPKKSICWLSVSREKPLSSPWKLEFNPSPHLRSMQPDRRCTDCSTRSTIRPCSFCSKRGSQICRAWDSPSKACRCSVSFEPCILLLLSNTLLFQPVYP